MHPPLQAGEDESVSPDSDVDFTEIHKTALEIIQGTIGCILSESETHSKRWGCIVRIVYHPLIDGEIFEDEHISICWGTPGDYVGTFFSALNEY